MKKNKFLLLQPYKPNRYHFKKEPKNIKHILVISFAVLCVVSIILLYAGSRGWFKKSSAPVYKPVEETFEDVATDIASEPTYQKTASTIELTEDIYYDNGKLIIARAFLENENIQQNDYDNELRYVFDVKFIKSISKIIQVNDDVINSIELTPLSIIVNSRKFSAFNISNDDDYVYIDYISPRDKYDVIVFLDPGHGDVDYGADINGIMEKDLNLNLALKVYRLSLLYSPENIKVYMTRDTDCWLTPEDRVSIADSIGDLFISIHHNVYEYGSEPYGTETYYKDIPGVESPGGLTSGITAGILQKHIVKQINSRDRGIMYNDSYYILNHATIPTALTEIGYMTNPEELEKLLDDEYSSLAATGIYNGIIEICNEWLNR